MEDLKKPPVISETYIHDVLNCTEMNEKSMLMNRSRTNLSLHADLSSMPAMPDHSILTVDVESVRSREQELGQ